MSLITGGHHARDAEKRAGVPPCSLRMGQAAAFGAFMDEWPRPATCRKPPKLLPRTRGTDRAFSSLRPKTFRVRTAPSTESFPNTVSFSRIGPVRRSPGCPECSDPEGGSHLPHGRRLPTAISPALFELMAGFPEAPLPAASPFDGEAIRMARQRECLERLAAARDQNVGNLCHQLGEW